MPRGIDRVIDILGDRIPDGDVWKLQKRRPQGRW